MSDSGDLEVCSWWRCALDGGVLLMEVCSGGVHHLFAALITYLGKQDGVRMQIIVSC